MERAKPILTEEQMRLLTARRVAELNRVPVSVVNQMLNEHGFELKELVPEECLPGLDIFERIAARNIRRMRDRRIQDENLRATAQ